MNKIETQEHIKSIDGLKGICACMIAFAWHYQHFAPVAYPFYTVLMPFYKYGLYLVEIFFMLSGFGMTRGYERKIQKEEISFLPFLEKRILKLFPTMILATIVTALLEMLYLMKTGTIFVYPLENFDLYHFALNILGLQYGVLGEDFSFNAPTWFISVLLLCYMIFYLLNYFCKKHGDIIACGYLIFALAGCVLLVRYTNSGEPLLNGSVGSGMACFFIGCLLCKICFTAHLNVKRIGYSAFVLGILSGLGG